MRIEGFLPVAAVRHAAERPPPGGFAAGLAAPAPPAMRSFAPTTIAPLAGMLALQTLAVAGEGRRRAIRRGASLLETLDELQAALLDDGASAERIAARLAFQLSKREPEQSDLELAAILDAIELRAHIEMAKIERDAGTAGR